MTRDREIADRATSTVGHVLPTVNEPVVATYSYQSEPTSGLTAVASELKEPTEASNLLAEARWQMI